MLVHISVDYQLKPVPAIAYITELCAIPQNRQKSACKNWLTVGNIPKIKNRNKK